MDNLEETYQKLFKEAEDNPEILGIILGGSRGKDTKFVTENSDYDVVVVVSDNASGKLKQRIESYGSDKFEVWPKTLSDFRKHAEWGSAHDWDRYNYTHNKPVLDKTGELGNLINEKGNIPKERQRDFIENALDCYINSVYRSAKYWRDGNEFAALLDASESMPYLMDALYALEGRVKPYNKYFVWELRNHPLTLLPWSTDDFITDYKTILTTGDIRIQEKIYQGIKKLFDDHGYNRSLEGWKGKYFVG